MAKSSRGGRLGGGGGLNPANITSTSDLVSERERNRREVDDVLKVSKAMNDTHGATVEQFQIADIKGKDGASVLAYYDNGNNIAINRNFFDSAAITAAYDKNVTDGFHPGRGNKSAMEAVTAHEFGHALTNRAVSKLSGAYDLNSAANLIVNEARKATTHRGVVQMAAKISKYATQSNAEAIAEACADVYCNGRKARSESTAIYNTLKKYL